jgi:murein DD-endopeptidase MepM/ murein hydrolase activator NlpD
MRPSRPRSGRVLTGLLATLLVLGALVAAGTQMGWIEIRRGEAPADSVAGAATAAAPAGTQAVPPAAVTAPGAAGDTPALPPVDPALADLAARDTAARDTKLPLDTLSGLGVDPRSTAAPGAAPTANAAETAALRGRMIVPVQGVAAGALRDDFDQARGGGTRRHEALDIPAPRGTPVVAATDGRVVKLFDSEAGGLTVYQADAENRFVLLYGHLDRYEPTLREGAPVRRGQVLGYVGTTGNASVDVPHLHFAVARSADPARWWGSGTPVNPYDLLRP